VIETDDAPWPVVDECYGHRTTKQRGDAEPTCPQCDGSHRHRWLAWHQAPQVAPGTSCVVQMSGPGLPVRCAQCGTRKCDDPVCTERRHHRGPHHGLDDSVRGIGEVHARDILKGQQ
jgi:hypothetical protein